MILTGTGKSKKKMELSNEKLELTNYSYIHHPSCIPLSSSPTSDQQPTILLTKNELVAYKHDSKMSLDFYIDIHAHSTLMNGFSKFFKRGVTECLIYPFYYFFTLSFSLSPSTNKCTAMYTRMTKCFKIKKFSRSSWTRKFVIFRFGILPSMQISSKRAQVGGKKGRVEREDKGLVTWILCVFIFR